jgi:predicted O-methyltransferase YrrM
LHPIVERIFETQTVTDGDHVYPATNAQGQPTYMDRAEAALIQRVIAQARPTTTLEVGMAYGVSTVTICEALATLPHSATHIAIDPHQSTKWRGIGLHNVRAAGLDGKLRVIEERSEFCLPRLLHEGTAIQVALIDGLHIFEQCALELYYIDRMLPVGGVVIFDDVDWPPIRRVVRMALSYGTYQVADHTGTVSHRRTLLRRAVKMVRLLPGTERLVRPDVLVPDSDLGLAGACVALRKVQSGLRRHGDYQEF